MADKGLPPLLGAPWERQRTKRPDRYGLDARAIPGVRKRLVGFLQHAVFEGQPQAQLDSLRSTLANLDLYARSPERSFMELTSIKYEHMRAAADDLLFHY